MIATGQDTFHTVVEFFQLACHDFGWIATMLYIASVALNYKKTPSQVNAFELSDKNSLFYSPLFY
jgi:hypothetical protein